MNEAQQPLVEVKDPGKKSKLRVVTESMISAILSPWGANTDELRNRVKNDLAAGKTQQEIQAELSGEQGSTDHLHD